MCVDLTSKDVLPIWLHPETVGGRFRKEEASLLNGDEPEDSLARLGAVLRNAAESQKFFRSSAQWITAWWKCEPIALSVSQPSWVSKTQDVVPLQHQEEICIEVALASLESRGWP